MYHHFNESLEERWVTLANRCIPTQLTGFPEGPGLRLTWPDLRQGMASTIMDSMGGTPQTMIYYFNDSLEEK